MKETNMVIDIHSHLTAPMELYAYRSGLLSHRGAHGRGGPKVSDEQLVKAIHTPLSQFGDISHIDHLDQAGIGTQLISPRPYTLMHSEQPAKLVRWFIEETNNLLSRQCALSDGRFRAVAALSQHPGTGVEWAVAELERCVSELGAVGCLLNPDPHEGSGPEPPGLGDEYWYPLYEKLVELNVPALVHSAGCRSSRVSYSLHFIIEETIGVMSLMNSTVFQDFPDLKLIISHGGGAVPYQVGRFMAGRIRRGEERFEESLRRLYFDTCLYTKESLELLFRVVGPDRCLFGSEKPGTGSAVDPDTGRWFDDVRSLIEDIEWLSDEDRAAVLHRNAEQVFGLKDAG